MRSVVPVPVPVPVPVRSAVRLPSADLAAMDGELAGCAAAAGGAGMVPAREAVEDGNTA
jgi:hypothetical protein